MQVTRPGPSEMEPLAISSDDPLWVSSSGSPNAKSAVDAPSGSSGSLGSSEIGMQSFHQRFCLMMIDFAQRSETIWNPFVPRESMCVDSTRLRPHSSHTSTNPTQRRWYFLPAIMSYIELCTYPFTLTSCLNLSRINRETLSIPL